jgi:hypothetical protein
VPLSAVVALVFAMAACGGDDSPGGSNAGGTTHGGASGSTSQAAGTAGDSATTGDAGKTSTTGGVTGGGASLGGAGGQLSGEQLKAEAYQECDAGCALIEAACPGFKSATCRSTCHDQADSFAASGECGLEHYRYLSCVNDTQKVADVTCVPNGAEFAGCKVELAAYDACIQG